ncbi:hypothetical protein NGTWS0302_21750 [Mycolicibacterium cyprinidarum]|uniref:Secreted protein n=1 Tax=Mycolicibacterium cyprinidarum TaxID=2860311 RepID=A0ABQ4V6X8_9MYCO|nr:hypothetical protein NGTWS0302_21750 [Mycolicibacterium sp. NGTWS0302]GJF08783.1 hypothetical protein NGTWS1702_02000 [Mycolicibacterium sp. NGTWSNA01]GJF10021.1 hypothetical protein NGTWS1803_16110 [Mycolicibacterium sp. NGTWS1803]
MAETLSNPHGGRLQIPRSRGAASGLLVMALGLWGALVPFVGPYFDFAFSPDRPWAWTAGRGWLEVLPGVVAVLGGLLMFSSRNRAAAMFGTWIAVLAGAWFVVGRALAGPLGLGDVGVPVAVTEAKQVTLELAYFYGLGALIVFLAALALGRLSVRTARDIAYTDTRAQVVAGESDPEPTVVEPVDNSDELPSEREQRAGTSDAEKSQPVSRRWSVFDRRKRRADPKLSV